MSTRSPLRRLGALTVAAALGTVTLTACGQDQPADPDAPRTFTILQYEDPNSPQAQGWKKAVELFEAEHPNVTVDFQQTSFDAMRQNAKITLSGNDVPDVIEFNKGNADGGQLAGQGLLEPLTEQVEERGWDEKVTGSMAAFAQYDENGMAGSGDWYGIPNIGEFVMLYYNKELFAEAGITELPTTLEDFEAAMDQLMAAGILPISSSANTSQGFNQMWVWYSLVSAEASRDQIDDFMFVRNPVDFSAAPWGTGTARFQEWIDKGYVGDQLGGLSFEQAIVNFLSGDAAMVMWNDPQFARISNDAQFDWGYFTLPGANLSMGSSGHLWGVPAKAENKDLAYDWIDITLSQEVQDTISAAGGLALAGDTSKIEDEAYRGLAERFNELVEADTLSFYPDYPVPGFLDFIQNHMQAMSNKNETADEYIAALQEFYDEGTQS